MQTYNCLGFFVRATHYKVNRKDIGACEERTMENTLSEA